MNIEKLNKELKKISDHNECKKVIELLIKEMEVKNETKNN